MIRNSAKGIPNSFFGDCSPELRMASSQLPEIAYGFTPYTAVTLRIKNIGGTHAYVRKYIKSSSALTYVRTLVLIHAGPPVNRSSSQEIANHCIRTYVKLYEENASAFKVCKAAHRCS